MKADFYLASSGWADEIESGFAESVGGSWIVSPFIKLRPIRDLVPKAKMRSLKIITRFNLDDFYNGVSDIGALRYLVENGAQVRGVRGLHSKLYVFGEGKCIVSSANFTQSGLHANKEFGFVTTKPEIIKECGRYCMEMWGGGLVDLDLATLDDWAGQVEAHCREGAALARVRLPDFGSDILDEQGRSLIVSEPEVASFIKFFGSADRRAPLSMMVIDEVVRSGSHWACTYSRRPRQVSDGDLMFMGRMVHSPNDYRIYGEAIGRKHMDERDEASEVDLKLREWKGRWPYYIRVHKPRFLNGNLANGISLNRLMDELGADAFEPTRRNALRQEGNTLPRRALVQKPAMQLTGLATEWLRQELDLAYEAHGQLDLSNPELDWPS